MTRFHQFAVSNRWRTCWTLHRHRTPGYALGTPVRSRDATREGPRRLSAARLAERASEAFRKPVITDPAYIKRCRRQSPAAGRGLRLPSLFLYPFLFSAFLLPRSRASPPSPSPPPSSSLPGPYFYRVRSNCCSNIGPVRWTPV